MKKLLKQISIGLFTILLSASSAFPQEPYIIVLGIAQDGGFPHLGCTKECCTNALENTALKRYVVSLALVEPQEKKWYLFEATPDMSDQIQYFRELSKGEYNYLPDAIFVSHAHIGHYTGLMELGKEAMNSESVDLYSLPRMSKFLQNNGPWSQLVDLNNIEVKEVNPGSTIELSESILVTIFEVPHRDEFSETAAYNIFTSGNDYLFIPDIDKWGKWNKDIEAEVNKVDYAFIDGTFYSGDELPGRNMNQIPHPFIVETMKQFESKSPDTKKKINFIHLNHSNPALSKQEVKACIEEKGFRIAIQGKKY